MFFAHLRAWLAQRFAKPVIPHVAVKRGFYHQSYDIVPAHKSDAGWYVTDSRHRAVFLNPDGSVNGHEHAKWLPFKDCVEIHIDMMLDVNNIFERDQQDAYLRHEHYRRY
jgi:hypothetical protein